MTRPIAVAGHLRIYLPTCEEISLLVYCIILGSMLSTVSLDAKSRKYLSDKIEKKTMANPTSLYSICLVYMCPRFVRLARTCVRVYVRASLDKCAY